jgi:hypothetical protein
MIKLLFLQALQFFVIIKCTQTVEIFTHFITCTYYDKAEFQHCINTALYQASTHHNEI